MNINNIQKNLRYEKTRRRISISIKVSEEVSKWLREKNYSPTGIFNEALKELDCPAFAKAPIPTEQPSEK